MTERGYRQLDLMAVSGKTWRFSPYFLRRKDCWKVLDGKWELLLPDRFVYHRESKISSRENALIIGSSNWNKFTLDVTFRMLSGSIKPPEGGVIVFFLFQNIKNYYSFHFCLYKQKVELIKRLNGVWTTIAEHDYNLVIGKEYRATVRTNSGIHQCYIDDMNQIETFDGDISRGCIGIGAKYCDVEICRVSIRYRLKV